MKAKNAWYNRAWMKCHRWAVRQWNKLSWKLYFTGVYSSFVALCFLNIKSFFANLIINDIKNTVEEVRSAMKIVMLQWKLNLLIEINLWRNNWQVFRKKKFTLKIYILIFISEVTRSLVQPTLTKTLDKNTSIMIFFNFIKIILEMAHFIIFVSIIFWRIRKILQNHKNHFFFVKLLSNKVPDS